MFGLCFECLVLGWCIDCVRLGGLVFSDLWLEVSLV